MARKKAAKNAGSGSVKAARAPLSGRAALHALALELHGIIRAALTHYGFSPTEQERVFAQSQSGSRTKPASAELLAQIRRLSDLLTTWFEEAPYIDSVGSPRVLKIAGGQASFETLAKRFPECKFTLQIWDQTDHCFGEVAWQNGLRTLFVPMFGMKMQDDADEPANDAVTEAMKLTAAELVRAAAEACNGISPDTSAAETTVAEVIASSGRSVKINFQPNDDGSCCLCILA